MIEIKNVQTINGRRIHYFVKSNEEKVIEAEHLTLFPALIDPHVHFRTPGAEHKENWESGAQAAIAGGVTTVFDMPNTNPPTITLKTLQEKKQRIDKQLEKQSIPLRYHLYFGADAHHLDALPQVKDLVIGLKIYMGSSTGNLGMSDQNALEKAFQIASKCDLLVTVHAEDEQIIEHNQKIYAHRKDPSAHSEIRSPAAASAAVALAIATAKKYQTRLYIAHVSCQEELKLIRSAKKEGLPIYAEACPHHLFLDESAYAILGTKGTVNPPLRKKTDCEALWEAIYDGVIDTIGTDHAPHTLEEKMRPYPSPPSGLPSIELYFPLLLNAYHQKKLTLEQIVCLTHTRPQEIFRIPVNDDLVLVDMNKTKTVKDAMLKTKAKWSPYAEWTLQGWPRYTILDGILFDLEKELS